MEYFVCSGGKFSKDIKIHFKSENDYTRIYNYVKGEGIYIIGIQTKFTLRLNFLESL